MGELPKVYDSQTAHFPTCDICAGNLGRRVCNIEVHGKELIVCGGCYTFHRRLLDFVRVGILEVQPRPSVSPSTERSAVDRAQWNKEQRAKEMAYLRQHGKMAGLDGFNTGPEETPKTPSEED